MDGNHVMGPRDQALDQALTRTPVLDLVVEHQPQGPGDRRIGHRRHGSEMPLDAGAGTYAAGFMLATALLHMGGIALGAAIGRIGEAYGLAAYRLGGGLVALAGVAILAHLI